MFEEPDVISKQVADRYEIGTERAAGSVKTFLTALCDRGFLS